jgi:hypothetical protein
MLIAVLPKQTKRTFSTVEFRSKNLFASATAIRVARSTGKPYAPVLMDAPERIGEALFVGCQSEYRS